MKKSILKMSLIASIALSSGAYAGKIVGANAGDPHISNVQYGFGGWNLTGVTWNDSDVDVYITNLDYVDNGKIFNEDNGSYEPMGANESFESQIFTENEHRANLHGKDWPVGEPAGIKIINEDTDVEHGKPVNCIMTTSYLAVTDLNESGFLNTTATAGPVPTRCSSTFQTHKRFKVNLLSNTIGNLNEYGQPIDLVFNLDSNDTSEGVTRYQVFQKINNYTGYRLNGYKLEVLDENGTKNDALTLSLGEGEGIYVNNPERTDIWLTEDMANFAHGLWGPIDKHFPEPGFFDSDRAYYPVKLSADKQSIEYFGDLLGGNYQDLFGNWLTVDWAPTGMFWDDDDNDKTDALLIAFFGVAPGYSELGWYEHSIDATDPENPIYTWSPVTIEDYALWSSSDLYEAGAIEDTLNLGLNYIVNVGENSKIGETFTIRITPHVDSNQTAPSYYGVTPSYDITSKGVIGIVPNPIFVPGSDLNVSVGDTDLNDPSQVDTVDVTVVNDMGDEETLTLTETDFNSSVFLGTIATAVDAANQADGHITVQEDTVVTAIYIDVSEGNIEVNASTTAHTIALPVVDAGEDQTIPLNGSATLTGTIVSQDPYVTSVSYKWKEGQTLLAVTPTYVYVPTSEGVHTLTFIVTDNFGGVGKDDVNITVTAAENPSSGGGGGCTYNPNSKSFDMTFLMLMALGLLYPFRRRFIK